MKKTPLLLLTSFCLFSLIIFACRKEVSNFVNDRESPTTSLIEDAKIWRLSHMQTNYNALKPLWNEAYLIKNQSVVQIVVPTAENTLQNKEISIRRVYLFKKEGSVITKGIIVEIISNKPDVSENLDNIIKNISSSSISGFDGAIIEYNIDYFLLRSSVYRNGIKSRSTVEYVKDEGATKQNLNGSNISFSGFKQKLMTVVPGGVPTYFHNYPPTLCPNGIVNHTLQTTYDADGDPQRYDYTFNYVRCPGDNTSGSGGGSWSSSSNGSGGSGSGNSGGTIPDYGGQPTGAIYICECPCFVEEPLMIPADQAFEPKWGQLGTLQDIKNEVNSVVFNYPGFSSLNLKFQLAIIRDHFEANRLFTRNSQGELVDAAGSKRVDRYIYTQNNGWIDMHHFFYAAALSEESGPLYAGFETKSAEYIQEQLAGQSSSAFSYEDLPSNYAGINFWKENAAGLKNGTKDFNGAIMVFFNSKNAVAPSLAPNYPYIPHIIDGNVLKNRTYTGLTGEILRTEGKANFCKKSIDAQQKIKEAHLVLSPSAH